MLLDGRPLRGFAGFAAWLSPEMVERFETESPDSRYGRSLDESIRSRSKPRRPSRSGNCNRTQSRVACRYAQAHAHVPCCTGGNSTGSPDVRDHCDSQPLRSGGCEFCARATRLMETLCAGEDSARIGGQLPPGGGESGLRTPDGTLGIVATGHLNGNLFQTSLTICRRGTGNSFAIRVM